MTTKHYCDVCDEQMEDGYTVTWQDDVDSGGILYTSKIPDRTEKNVCEDCWPGEESWFDGLRVLLK